jgi:hypothetical protein
VITVATAQYIDVEILLLQTDGLFFQPGSPSLLCRFKVLHLPGTQVQGAHISVVACIDQRENVWKEFSQELSIEQAQTIVESLEELGIPGRSLDVKGIVDTGDGWSDILLQVQRQDQTFVQNIAMQWSGFSGNDAEKLKALFRQLFNLAGYEGYSKTIYGR